MNNQTDVLHEKLEQCPSGEVIAIPLTKDKFTIIDREDCERVMQYKWCFGGRGYAIRAGKYANGKQSPNIKLHRFLINAPAGYEVDHINGDTLDNRKANIRVCTVQQNQRNRSLGKNNSSGYKGVTWVKAQGKWRAQLALSKGKRYLKSFDTAIEAALAYDEVALEHFGEFALTNQMMGLLPVVYASELKGGE